MKNLRRFILMVCSLVVLEFIANFAIAQPQQDLGEIIVKGFIANIRSGPGTQYSIVTKVYKGDRLKLISKSGSWYQIKLSDEKRGWVYANLVQINEAIFWQACLQEGTEKAYKDY